MQSIVVDGEEIQI